MVTVASRPLRLFARVAALEVALTIVELGLVGGPLCAGVRALAGSTRPLHAAVLALGAAMWLAAGLRLFEVLRPVVRVMRARQRQEPVAASDVDPAQRALARVPYESAALRFVLWLGVALAQVLLSRRSLGDNLVLGAGLLAATLLHAAGAAAARALILGSALAQARPHVLPNLDPMRAFSGAYRTDLRLGAVAALGLMHAALAAFAAAFTAATGTQVAAASLLLWPVLLPGAFFWARSLSRRSRPVEGYFDVALRHPGTRGPARDEPKAVQAFGAAQTLPYRLAGYAAFVVLLAGVLSVAASRRVLLLPIPTAARLLAALGVVVVLGALYHALWTRARLRPFLRHLGSRHALPTAEIRARLGLEPKLAGLFIGIVGATGGLVALFLTTPAERWPVAAPAFGASGLLLAGLVVLVVRELCAPIQALEARAEEMARGELARPLPPSGEADELGRLAVAFEEMRRALRDRLRSTESINIDLEREVRRRTEALEQRNAELRDALDKLRRAQDDLVRSEKLASMGRLVAGIAHEINNPVNAVINSLGPLDETVRELADARTPAATREAATAAGEMLAVIQRGAARTKAIVQALHNYSRGDDASPREVNLGRSIDDTLDLLRHRLRNVQIVKEVEPGLRLRGFPGQIDQVFMNLITNAAQALGERGGTIRIGARPLADGIEVWVADDGPGIPPEVLPRIFDPFFTTKDVGEGSGLGLSIVHGIVDRHGGRIDVDSTVGQGTTFRLTFSNAVAAAPVAAARGAAS